jgi:hypothetical protein
MAADRKARVLLTEGSSLTAREVVTALGPLGYRLEVCDPNPICMARFSRYVHAVHRCPPLGADPISHLESILGVLGRNRYDVLLPVHEQAFLLASQRERVAGHAGLAVASFEAFQQVQGKTAFAALLAELGLPQPEWRIARSGRELLDLRAHHHYVKAPYSTAGQGVWRVSGEADLARVARLLEDRRLFAGDGEVLVQAAVEGPSCQVQSIFEHGHLVASHCTVREAEGVGGGYAARRSVHHPVVREHLEIIGARLRWHGGLALDYFLDANGQPSYIEANPRLVEPMNGVLSGLNLADILVRLSLGETCGGRAPLLGRCGVRSHGLMGLCLGVAVRGGSRRDLVGTIAEAARGRCAGHPSAEVQTPVRRDPLSAVPLALVTARLLVSPRSASGIAGKAVGDYSLTADAVRTIVESAE